MKDAHEEGDNKELGLRNLLGKDIGNSVVFGEEAKVFDKCGFFAPSWQHLGLLVILGGCSY